MQAKSLLLGAAAGIGLVLCSLTFIPSRAMAKGADLVPQINNEPTLISMDNDNLYIVRYGTVYKVNKLGLVIASRAYLR